MTYRFHSAIALGLCTIIFESVSNVCGSKLLSEEK